MPLIRAARVIKCRARVPVGWPGYPCVRAARMARYLRRLSLIADSFWIHGSFQREYTMRQPLNLLFQNGLAKCPVENAGKDFYRDGMAVLVAEEAEDNLALAFFAIAV